jgi:hypothetical protein
MQIFVGFLPLDAFEHLVARSSKKLALVGQFQTKNMPKISPPEWALVWSIRDRKHQRLF